MTRVANIQARKTKLLYRSAHGLGECNVDLIFEIIARLAFRRCLRGVGPSEKLAEKISKTGAAAGPTGSLACSAAKIEPAEVKMYVLGGASAAVARSGTPALAGNIESELVIRLPLLGIGKGVVRFLNLLEFFFCGLVTRIQVRMIFAG